MVNIGKPSRGCDVCRKRRIKCDEALPGCSYCFKKRINCPGYKSHFDIAWRDQNRTAANSVNRRRKVAERAERERQTSTQLLKPSSAFPNPPWVFTQDYEAYALNFFLASYILPRKDLGVHRSFLDCLYPVWLQADTTSPLHPAITAVASVLLGVWSLLRADVPLSFARPHYLKGIESLRKTLQAAQHVTDDVLIAALLLDMYAGLQSSFTSKRNDSPHAAGVSALIEARNYPENGSELSVRVLDGARNQVVGRAMQKSEPVSARLSKWSQAPQPSANSPALNFDSLNIELANLRALASHLKQSGDIDDMTPRLLLSKAVELDQQYVSWLKTIPPSWNPILVSGTERVPPSVRSAGLYQSYCFIYKNIFVADALNLFHCSRVKVHLVALTCLECLDVQSERAECEIPNGSPVSITPEDALSAIQVSADAICASVPYHLGDRVSIARLDDKSARYPSTGAPVAEDHHSESAAFGGWCLAGKLSELLMPGVKLREGQKQWILGQMGRLQRLHAIQGQ